MYYAGALLVHPFWTNPQLEEVIGGLSAEQLQLFISHLLSALHIEALVMGNVSKDEALREVALVGDTLSRCSGTRPLPLSAVNRHRTIQLPNGSSHLYTVPNAVHNSSSLEVYLQTGQEDTRSNVLLELTAQIISEPCFNVLRTKEQLGYIVSSGLRRSNGVQGLRIVVQSDRDVDYVERRTEAFLIRMQSHISGLEEEEFAAHKKALEVKRLEKPKTMAEECRRCWSEIAAGTYYFNRDEEEVAVLKTITREDVVAFFKDHLSLDGHYRKKLVVHAIPTNRTESSSEENGGGGGREGTRGGGEGGSGGGGGGEGGSGEVEETDIGEPLLPQPTVISDIAGFKGSLPLFPPTTPHISTSL
jgi:insulysin